MDPVTQGVLGAAVTQAVMTERVGRKAWLYGALGGMAADLDVLIRSADDPLVAITFHRHFTHSLAFIPVGGLLVALPFALPILKKEPARARAIALATTIGYATHALLDAFTSYGTLLWWPLSRARVAWNVIGIVDLTYTVPLAVAVVWAAWRISARPARWGLVVSSLYMALCGLQRGRALDAQERLAKARGHAPTRAQVFPTVTNNVTWRSIYEADGALHVDKLRVPYFRGPLVVEGGAVPVMTVDELPAAVRADPKAMHAWEVFAWFSLGWLGQVPGDPWAVGDARYAITPNATEPLWGLRYEARGDAIAYTQFSSRARLSQDVSLGLVWRLLFTDEGARPL